VAINKQAPGAAPDTALRSAAEASLWSPSLAAARPGVEASSATDIQTLGLVHELRVHQVELEMQNDELRSQRVELDAQRATYVDLFDLAPVGYCVVDAQGVVQRANPAAAALLGVPRVALVGQRLGAFVDAEDGAAFAALLARAAAGAVAPPCELRLLRHGGAAWWASLVVGAVADARGGGTERHVILSDITLAKATAVLVAAELQRTERALALNRVLLEVRDFDASDVGAYVRAVTEAAARAVGAAAVSLWVAEMEGAVLQCRGRFDAGSGVHEPGGRIRVGQFPRYFAALQVSDVLAADDALADPRTNEFAPDCMQPLGITSMLDVPLRVGGNLAGVLCIEHRGPARRWSVEEQSFAHALANIALHAIAHIERSQAVAARQIAEQHLRTLLDGMAERAWLKDRQGRYLALNRSEAQALGVPAEKALGKTIQELRPDAPVHELAVEDERAMQSTLPSRIERVAVLGGVWLEVVRAPLLGADGGVQGLVGIARDISERKRVERALIESEARFRALTEMSADWFWETDAQGRYTMMVGRDGKGPHLKFRDAFGRNNQEIQALTGVRREQLSPSPEEYARVKAEHRGCRNGFCKWIFPDGSVTFLRFSFEPMFGADGDFRGFRGVSSDVTQREHDAQALAQTQARLELALRASDITLHEWDVKRDALTVRGVPGPTAKTVIERPLSEALALTYPEDAARLRLANEAVLRGESRGIDVEYRVPRMNGEWSWRRLQAHLIDADPASGEVLRVSGTSSDIDSRKRAELALAEANRDLEARVAARTEALALSEARFRAVMTDAPLGILIVAPDRRIAEANPRICDIVGYPKQALIGMGIEQLTHPDDWPANAALATPMERGELQRFVLEKRYIRGDGGVVWVRLHVAAVNDLQGKHLYRISVVEDITERRATEARLSEYAAHVSALSGRLLRAQEDERRHLARELHDDVGQVLTAVKMALGAVQQQRAAAGGAADDARLAAANAVVNTAIARVRGLWQELRPPLLDDLGLVTALRGLCAQAERLAPMTVTLQVQGEVSAIPNPLAEVLYRICQEALTNAARHSGASRVDVGLRVRGTEVALLVHDNGAGFDAASASRTDRLGLVGMRERVKLQDGVLTIDSAPGAGTRISAEFGGTRAPTTPAAG
jgi:PAS domain S-box-containing protein